MDSIIFIKIFNHLGHYYPRCIIILYNDKAGKATTLSGYGITDAYTKTEVDNKSIKVTQKTYTNLPGYVTVQPSDISGASRIVFAAPVRGSGTPTAYLAASTYEVLNNGLLVGFRDTGITSCVMIIFYI